MKTPQMLLATIAVLGLAGAAKADLAYTFTTGVEGF